MELLPTLKHPEYMKFDQQWFNKNGKTPKDGHYAVFFQDIVASTTAEVALVNDIKQRLFGLDVMSHVTSVNAAIKEEDTNM